MPIGTGTTFTGTMDNTSGDLSGQTAGDAQGIDEARRKRQAFQIAGLSKLQAETDARRFGYQQQASQSLADSLAARQAQTQNAQQLNARAMGLGPSSVGSERSLATALAGQQTMARAASGQGGNPILARRMAMQGGALTMQDIGAKAAGAQLRESGEADSGLGRALAAQRGADTTEYGQSGEAANAYLSAERQVAIRDAEMRAAYQRALTQAQLAQMGAATQQAGFDADLAQRQRESDRAFLGSLISAGAQGTAFAASNWPSDSMTYDPNSKIYRGNPYG